MTELSLDLIRNASAALKGKIRTTPTEYSPQLSKLIGEEVYLKLENLQLTGSFKIRGAYFRLLKLSEEEKKEGIITCSAGNHGKAVAYVAQKTGIKTTIYVPQNVDQSKYDGIRSYGVDVVRSSYPGYDDTEALARSVSQDTGKPFISAFDDPLIMAANGGTLAMETLEQTPEAKTLLFPVGGGGLAAGACFYIRETDRKIKLVGCQHKESPALQLSLEQKKAVTKLPPVETAAGGIEGGIGESCFDIIQPRIDECCLLTEEEILEGFRYCLAHHQYLIEPSAAVVIAAILTGRVQVENGPVVLIVSGRNVSLESIKNSLCQVK